MARATQVAEAVLAATERLRRGVNGLSFAPPVAYVYNPLDYAAAPHRVYVERFARKKKRVVFLGMNPGPFGMAQTGVPFGEVAAVRDWMGIDAQVTRPKHEHEKRPIQGFACARSEVSGSRLWGLFAERFGEPEAFFAEHYVANYCPLVFLEEGGRNRTPDKLPRAERDLLEAVCDRHLAELVDILAPEVVVGVGKFAQDRARLVVGEGVRVETILHPSPASPAANRGWAPAATKQLEAASIW